MYGVRASGSGAEHRLRAPSLQPPQPGALHGLQRGSGKWGRICRIQQSTSPFIALNQVGEEPCRYRSPKRTPVTPVAGMLGAVLQPRGAPFCHEGWVWVVSAAPGSQGSFLPQRWAPLLAGGQLGNVCVLPALLLFGPHTPHNRIRQSMNLPCNDLIAKCLIFLIFLERTGLKPSLGKRI